MASKIKISIEEYLTFLEDYLILFKIKIVPRKKIQGTNFKI